MKTLKENLLKEIPQFREHGHKFINKEISSLEFKSVSGGMGVYAQRGGEQFMIRLRVPSGIMSIDYLKSVYKLAENKKLDQIHLTSRQAIQFHDLSIDDVCDVMEDALYENIYTRGGGGNFPRNVSISPLTGVDKEEAFDVEPYAMLVNNHFMKNITTYKLPRKLKVSFSSSLKDIGNSSIADLGFLAVNKDEKKYFKVYLAGGLGKNPSKSVEFDELISPDDVLYHVEAILSLFRAEGDYENKNKARTRYIVTRMGEEQFIKCYKEHLKLVKEQLNLHNDIEFKNYNKDGINIDLKHTRLIPQKQEGLYTVYFHPINGQLKMDVLKTILDKLENIEDVQIRLAMSEGMYIRNLNGNEADELIKLTQNLGGETKLEQSVSCIGVPTCQIGIAHSQELLNEIREYFDVKNFKKDILPQIHISGCLNSCGTHQIGKIGFEGKKKRVDDATQEAFGLYMGGNIGNNKTQLGKHYGDILKKDIPEFLYELAKAIDTENLEYEIFIMEKSTILDELLKKYLV